MRFKISIVGTAFLALLFSASVFSQNPKFKRGDANQDGQVTGPDVGVIQNAFYKFVRGDVNNSGGADTADLIAIGNALPQFKRGDANQSGAVDMSDVSYIQSWLFSGGPAPPCLDAADANDSGTVNQTDSIYILNWLFNGGPAPPNPGPTSCGFDPTYETLGCANTWCTEQVINCMDAADVDDNGLFDSRDYDYLANYLFMQGPDLPDPFPECGTDSTSDSLVCTCNITCGGPFGLRCDDAADVDDDGEVDCVDATYLSNYLFGGGPQPPAPGPNNCGTDPTADGLGCTSPVCP